MASSIGVVEVVGSLAVFDAMEMDRVDSLISFTPGMG